MKLLSIFVLFFGLNSFANDNYTPEQQLCLSYGGQLQKLSVQYPQTKNYEFCFFSYSSGMEIKTLDRSQHNAYGGPEANRAYRAAKQHDFNNCMRFGGRNYRALAASENRYYDICVFFDESAILGRTIEEGYTSPWNRQLNNALGIF